MQICISVTMTWKTCVWLKLKCCLRKTDGRLMNLNLGKSTIDATIITRKRAGTWVFIHRMNLIPSEPGLPFKFRRMQFPLTLCLAMTINKSYLEWEFIFLGPCSRMNNSMSLSLELLLEKVWSCSYWMKIIMFARRPQMLCIV